MPALATKPPAPPVPLGRAAASGLVGTLLLRLAGGFATSALALYLRSLATDGAPISSISVGLVATGYYLTELLLSPVMGAVSDRLGRKGFMVAAPLVGAVALLLYPLTSAVPVLMLVRVLEGVSAAGAIPATLGYLSDLTEGSPARGRIMGLFEIVTLVGLAGGVILGPLLWSGLGSLTYPVLAVFYVAGALVFGLLLPPIGLTSRERRSWKDYRRILSSPRLVRFAPGWVAVNAILGVWTVHLQNQLSGPAGRVPEQALVGGLNGAALSRPFAFFSAAFLIGLYFWGARSGTGQRTTPMLWAGGGVFLAVACLTLLNHPAWLHLPGPAVFAGLLAGGFVMAGFTPVALAYLADISGDFPRDRGVVVGLYSVFLGLGQLLGGNIGGVFVNSWHIDGLSLFTALCALVAVAVVLGIRHLSDD
ncbi:MAG TPA: MFS transporter [Deinococcales bacterium]|nr:MFS transporter [Deinococcales bacterium]